MDVVIALALAAIAAIVVVPQRRVGRMMDNEDQIVADLLDVERRLTEHQKKAVRDTDRDGIGEFAPLGEVLGSRAAAAQRVDDRDVWLLDGYYFAVLTPGPRREPVLAGSEKAVTDYAEVSYMILAWPAEPGVTGMRAYVETPHGVLQHQIDGYPYSLDPPAPDWPMVALDGARIRRGGPYAGDDWRAPVRELRRDAGGGK